MNTRRFERQMARLKNELSGAISDTFHAMVIILALEQAATAATQPQTPEDAVKHCVDVVRSLGGSSFDAYYNPVTKTVHNNVTYVYQQQWLFEFEKCMTVTGFPLGNQAH